MSTKALLDLSLFSLTCYDDLYLWGDAVLWCHNIRYTINSDHHCVLLLKGFQASVQTLYVYDASLRFLAFSFLGIRWPHAHVKA